MSFLISPISLFSFIHPNVYFTCFQAAWELSIAFAEFISDYFKVISLEQTLEIKILSLSQD